MIVWSSFRTDRICACDCKLKAYRSELRVLFGSRLHTVSLASNSFRFHKNFKCVHATVTGKRKESGCESKRDRISVIRDGCSDPNVSNQCSRQKKVIGLTDSPSVHILDLHLEKRRTLKISR